MIFWKYLKYLPKKDIHYLTTISLVVLLNAIEIGAQKISPLNVHCHSFWFKICVSKVFQLIIDLLTLNQLNVICNPSRNVT